MDIGVIVTDLERSLGFYRDLLGLPVVAESTTSLIGSGRMIQLKYGESLIKLIALDKTPSERGPTGISAACGYRYMTLLTADITAVIAKLEQEAVTIALPVTRLGNGAMIAMVEDPDGNIVEFVQEAGH